MTSPGQLGRSSHINGSTKGLLSLNPKPSQTGHTSQTLLPWRHQMFRREPFGRHIARWAEGARSRVDKDQRCADYSGFSQKGPQRLDYTGRETEVSLQNPARLFEKSGEVPNDVNSVSYATIKQLDPRNS